MERFRSVCPLDCYDLCSFVIEKEGGNITKIAGDPEHPITKGFICSKGQGLVERITSPDRLLYPLLKEEGHWKRISWESAYDLMAEKIKKAVSEHGPKSILHLYGYGSGGALKALNQRFFNALGGVTMPEGSLCWGSGWEAQVLDFGRVYCHSWPDLLNSKTILLWGRDPAVTNIHIVPFLKQAQTLGAKIISINPVQTKSADLADWHVSLRPGTDGALALGMAYIILKERWLDYEFVQANTHGFEAFAKMVKNYPPEKVAEITGVKKEDIHQLAEIYAKGGPSSILFGYGLQRYSNGGKTVRAIDALGALTGNIGRPGGGVNYAHEYTKDLLTSIKGDELAHSKRFIPWPVMAQGILDATEPAIEVMFVTGVNPVSQLPNTEKVLEAFNKISFKVVIDFYLNDTAEAADLVLPCTTSFEEEDLIQSSWNQYIGYAPKVIEPKGEAKSEREIFGTLAKRLGLTNFGEFTAEEWINQVLVKAEEKGLTLEKLKKAPQPNPLFTDIAWQDKKFSTPTGKYEFYSVKAEEMGVEPLPVYTESRESLKANPWVAKEYPLYFLTPHPKGAIHSQFSNEESTNYPVVEINPTTAEERYIRNNDLVIVESPRGQMTGIARLSKRVPEYLVQVTEGRWIKHGGGVNFLTPDFIPDLGKGTPYYDCLCQVRKMAID